MRSCIGAYEILKQESRLSLGRASLPLSLSLFQNILCLLDGSQLNMKADAVKAEHGHRQQKIIFDPISFLCILQ